VIAHGGFLCFGISALCRLTMFVWLDAASLDSVATKPDNNVAPIIVHVAPELQSPSQRFLTIKPQRHFASALW